VGQSTITVPVPNAPYNSNRNPSVDHPPIWCSLGTLSSFSEICPVPNRWFAAEEQSGTFRINRRHPRETFDLSLIVPTINAVIVSGANSAWGAVQRGSGVRNITVTGGIIALGKTPLPGEPLAGSQQPDWLRVIPDPRLLDGSVIPPVVANLIDIRWLNCPINVIKNPDK